MNRIVPLLIICTLHVGCQKWALFNSMLLCFDISLSNYILYCKIYLTTPAKTLRKPSCSNFFFIIIWFQIIDIQSRFQNLLNLNIIMQITNDKYHKQLTQPSNISFIDMRTLKLSDHTREEKCLGTRFGETKEGRNQLFPVLWSLSNRQRSL